MPALPDLDAPEGQFSPALASAHYGQLASLGPRPPGSEADGLARTYLARALRRAGARVEELESEAGARHVLATLSGRSDDRVLIVVPWSGRPAPQAPDDAGAAVALELVRAVSTRPEPAYSLVVAFAEVGAEDGAEVGAEIGVEVAAEGRTEDRAVASASDGAATDARDRLRRAGRDLIRAMQSNRRFERVRGVIVLEPRADGATRMARDLRSHPVFRSIFWRAADDLGLEALFPGEATWSSPDGLQGALHAAGFGAVLALVDERAGRARAAEAVAPAPPAPTAPEEGGAPVADWARVGLVADEGLSRLMRRFERVDAFAPAD